MKIEFKHHKAEDVFPTKERVCAPLDAIVILRKRFRKENPATYKEMCCIVDDSYGEPSCVWDENKPEDCRYASKGIKKGDCKYWVSKTRDNEYSDNDVWSWLEKKAI